MQIDFSAAFDRVNPHGILYKLCTVGVGGSVLSILTQLIQTDRSMLWWMVVGVKWLTLCQAVIWAFIVRAQIVVKGSVTLQSFLPFWKIR